jgi:hypothetical protein
VSIQLCKEKLGDSNLGTRQGCEPLALFSAVLEFLGQGTWPEKEIKALKMGRY